MSLAGPADPLTRDDHYELGREIARGGMGRIVEAWDRRHQRPVAIKSLLRMGDAAARRFAREIEITAHLQHPAIIPLYEAGRWPSGEPFFAMKRVEGLALSDVVARTTDLRSRVALLPQLIAVSEALAYAHDQRIVHRDLKPANVLVGAFGEAVVIDWGLARAVDAPEDDRDEADDAPSAGEPLTRAGVAIGTPGYMPPEQASGARVDERADVYALGALLYHVFAGAPPYAGDSDSAILERVRREAPRPLADVVPELAPDLVAIVEKAMARDPAARYANAGELARDLRRFEAGQLVSARSYSFPELLRRWIARHRAIVTTTAVLVIALVVTASVSVRRIVRERDRADAARVSAVTHRDAAERVVEYVVGELRTRLEPIGRLDVLSGVGAKVSEYYDTIGAADGDASPAVLGRRATALATLSDVENAKRDRDRALALAQGAVALDRRALAAAPGDAEAKSRLAEDAIRVGYVEWSRAAFDRAGASYEEARALASQLVATDARSARWLSLLARAEGKVANVARDTGDRARARAGYERANDLLNQAVAIAPDDLDARYALGVAHSFLGDFVNDEDSARALAEYRACAETLEARAAVDTRWGRRGADCRSSIGRIESGQGRFDDALRDLQLALSERDALRKAEPLDRELVRQYSDSTMRLCTLFGAIDRFAESTPRCEETIAIGEQLAKESPDDAVAQEDLAGTLQRVADIDLHRGDAKLAATRLREAIAIGDAEWKRHPTKETWRSRLSRYRRDLARAELVRGDARAADVAYREAVDLHAGEAQSEDAPRMERAQLDVMGGQVAIALHDDGSARERLTSAIAIFEELQAKVASQRRALELAAALEELALVLQRRGDARGAAEAMQRGVAEMATFAALGRLQPSEERELARMRRELAAIPARR